MGEHIGRRFMSRYTGMRGSVTASVLGFVMAFVMAFAIAEGSSSAAGARYYFRLQEVESSVPLDGGMRQFAKEALAAELASRREWASDLGAGAASSDEALAAELKRRNLKGFEVKLKIANLKKEVKEAGASPRIKKLSIGVKLEVLGITLPGEKLAFSGDGEAAAETDVAETRLDKEADSLTKDVVKDAVKQAVDQAVLKLGMPKSAPMNEGKRKRR